MKKSLLLAAAIALCASVSPLALRADDKTAPTTVGKDHLDVNQWLDKHPKLKAEILGKFDTNKNGKLDGDEIPAFLKWLKERREKRKEDGGGKGATTPNTPPAITSPIISQ